jgi:hypothetical protein
MVLFVLLTLFTYRASRYLLPALPPLVLMIAGMWRKKFLSFLIPFLGAILIWHSVEFYGISKNLSHSPGMVLAGELRPFFKESTLIGYRVDRGTVEEINFYLDPVVPIPLIKRSENLSDQLMKKERVLVLMPKEVYFGIRKGNLCWFPINLISWSSFLVGDTSGGPYTGGRDSLPALKKILMLIRW